LNERVVSKRCRGVSWYGYHDFLYRLNVAHNPIGRSEVDVVLISSCISSPSWSSCCIAQPALESPEPQELVHHPIQTLTLIRRVDLVQPLACQLGARLAIDLPGVAHSGSIVDLSALFSPAPRPRTASPLHPTSHPRWLSRQARDPVCIAFLPPLYISCTHP
jgi:hypothetical protein